MANNSKTDVFTVKQIEIWDLRGKVEHTRGTFDLVEFKVIWG